MIAGPARPGAVPAFRRLWAIGLGANLCAMFQTVVAAWIMTQIGSRAFVALVQSAMSLPVLLFALLSGALSDLVDRRTMLLVAFTLMGTATWLLALAERASLAVPGVILALCFLFGSGTALFGPSTQAAVGDSLPTALVPEGVASIGMGYNLARSIGPALGGLLIALFGLAATLAINGVICLAIFAVILRWRRQGGPVSPPQFRRLPDLLREALSFANGSPEMRVILARAFLFAIAGSVAWALVPVVAREQLAGGSRIYGLLMSAMGGGAIGFAFLMRWLRARLRCEEMVRLGSLLSGTALILLPEVGRNVVLAMALLVPIGLCWTGVMTVWSAAAQLSAPRTLAGRAVGLFHSAMFGGMAVGGWVWGLIAEHAGLAAAFAGAGCLAIASALIGLRWPAPAGSAATLKISIETGEP